jgi:acylphosphatase
VRLNRFGWGRNSPLGLCGRARTSAAAQPRGMTRRWNWPPACSRLDTGVRDAIQQMGAPCSEGEGARLGRSFLSEWEKEAISGTVTGNDQHVGFRAMIMKQAIEYNLAGFTKNLPNDVVSFVLQGDGKRLNDAVSAIQEGTTKS